MTKVCAKCGAEFKTYVKNRPACSLSCGISLSNRRHPRGVAVFHAGRPKLIGPRGTVRACRGCADLFAWRGRRQYCSPCHAKKNTRRGGNLGARDSNHEEISRALSDAGAFVVDMSHVGKGTPDLAVSVGGVVHLIEIKNPTNRYGRSGLSPSQRSWADNWQGGSVAVVTSVVEALSAIGLPPTRTTPVVPAPPSTA